MIATAERLPPDRPSRARSRVVHSDDIGALVVLDLARPVHVVRAHASGTDFVLTPIWTAGIQAGRTGVVRRTIFAYPRRASALRALHA